MESVSKRLRFDEGVEDEEEEEGTSLGGREVEDRREMDDVVENEEDGALGLDWKREELACFFRTLREEGENWERLVEQLATEGFSRSVEQVEGLFDSHAGYLSLTDATANGLCAVVMDYQRRRTGDGSGRLVRRKERNGLKLEPGRGAKGGTARGRSTVARRTMMMVRPSSTTASARRRQRKRNFVRSRHFHEHVSRLEDDAAKGGKGGGSETNTGSGSHLMQNWLKNDFAVRWAMSEWFYSFLEVDFFQWNDFAEALTADMRLTPGVRVTPSEWGRIRSAMCSMYPGGPKPRRLSNKFLQEERSRLHAHIARSRAQLALETIPIGESVLAVDPSDGLPRRATVVAGGGGSGRGAVAGELTTRQLHVMFPAVLGSAAAAPSAAIIDDLNVALPRIPPSDAFFQTPGRLSSAPLTPMSNSGVAWPSGVGVGSVGGGAAGVSSPFLFSPPRPMDADAGVTVEIDLRQLAEVLMLLDAKKDILTDLWRLNNDVESLSDEHVRRCIELSELNSKLYPLVETLRPDPTASHKTALLPRRSVVPVLAMSLAQSVNGERGGRREGIPEQQLTTSCVAKCAAVLLHAASSLQQWQTGQMDLRRVVDSLGFKTQSNDPALVALKNAADAFTNTARSCEYV